LVDAKTVLGSDAPERIKASESEAIVSVKKLVETAKGLAPDRVGGKTDVLVITETGLRWK
jgi:hypothetical protein